MDAKVFLCVLNATLLFAIKLDLYRRKDGFTIQHPYFVTTGYGAVSCVAACNIDGNCQLVAFNFDTKQCSLGNHNSIDVATYIDNSVVYHKEHCEFGWTAVGERCLLFEGITASWQGCQDHCETLNGNLAHVYSLEDLDLVTSQIPCVWGADGCSPWLGINDIDDEGQLRGATGQNVTEDVESLLPNNDDSNDCAYFDTFDRALSLFECSYEDSCICEMETLV